MEQTLEISPNTNFSQLMNAPGEKVEVFWLRQTIGTEKIFHPVAQRRAQRILSDLREQANLLSDLRNMRNSIKEQTVDLVFFKKQAG
jgi:hypothetical protein